MSPIARQVPAAKTARTSVVRLLHKAAEQALSEGDAQLAVSCLRLAQQADDKGDKRRQAEVADRPAEEVRATHLWAALMYPTAGIPDLSQTAVPPSLSLDLEAVTVMSDAMRNGPDDRTRQVAHKILSGHGLDDRTVGPLLASLVLLVWAGNLAAAQEWGTRLAKRAGELRVPTWEAMFTALLAEVTANRGDLFLARDYGRHALELLPVRGWGVAVGLPLGTLVRVETAMGNGEEALRYLRMPVPEAVFGSPAGLHYLRARGLYQHLSGQYEAALDDFETIGVLATGWGMDNPWFIPWRSDAAEACLQLERTDQARALATEQLARVRAGDTRLNAVTQRVLACAGDPQKRPARLALVIDVLRNCPDSKLELANALVDFARAQQQLGRSAQAKVALRSAHQIAKLCGAALPGWALSQERSGEEQRMSKLSEAEQRVAMLAASGYSNRQISVKLFITVSTVEQHLTKIYRKLQVTSRADLAQGLYPDIAG